MEKPRIGMVGVGLMGHGIAANLVGKGWPLAYLVHAGNQPTDDIDAAGARPMESALGLAASCDILILCVTGSAQVEAILLGNDCELVKALKPGAVVIDCSTAIPSSTEKIAAKVGEHGGRFVDAAMTRTPKEAAEGRLNLLIGGDAETIAEVGPVLEAFSENRFHAGPAGSGHRLKLLHNFVSLGTVTLLAEAAACAAASGVDAETFVDCLKRGGGYGAALDRLSPYILDRDVSKLRFTNANALKDIGYYNAMIEETGTANRVGKGVLEALTWLNDAGLGDDMLPRQIDAFAKSS